MIAPLLIAVAALIALGLIMTAVAAGGAALIVAQINGVLSVLFGSEPPL